LKRIIAIAFIATASLFTIGSASAQDLGTKAIVPFDFIVNGKLLPADTYTLTSPSSGVITIRSSHTGVITLASPHDQSSGDAWQLVFTKYGSQYFLHEVLDPSRSLSVSIPTSKEEERVRREQASAKGSEIAHGAAE
jgi:hypothetical protein